MSGYKTGNTSGCIIRNEGGERGAQTLATIYLFVFFFTLKPIKHLIELNWGKNERGRKRERERERGSGFKTL